MSALTDDQRVVIAVVRCADELGTASRSRLAAAICAAFNRPPKGKHLKMANWMIGYAARCGYVTGSAGEMRVSDKARAEILDRVAEHQEGVRQEFEAMGYGAEVPDERASV